jgi:hypothetical protein
MIREASQTNRPTIGAATGGALALTLSRRAKLGKEYRVNPIEDLRPVCPNCPATLHREDPPFAVEELQSLVSGFADAHYSLKGRPVAGVSLNSLLASESRVRSWVYEL